MSNPQKSDKQCLILIFKFHILDFLADNGYCTEKHDINLHANSCHEPHDPVSKKQICVDQQDFMVHLILCYVM